MDLKLRDEITKLLIESPGLSIYDISKRIGNYYSYTHKTISEMEEEGLLEIKKSKKNGKEITSCVLSKEYKTKWINELSRDVKPLMRDAEFKAAFLLMYCFIAYLALTPYITRAPPHAEVFGAEMPLMQKAVLPESDGAPLRITGEVATSADLNPLELEIFVFICATLLTLLSVLREKKI